MPATLPPRLGIVILIAAATLFASNHTAARVAFDHGASVATGVVTRATGTALFLAVLMRLRGVPLALPRELRRWALLAGVLIAVQSYCLYSAVALIPPALALLVFQTSPMLYVLVTWALTGQAPRASAFPAMLAALAGLALALDIRLDSLATRWSEIGAGASWAFAGGASMAFVYYLNAHALKPLDGRLRTMLMTAVTAVLVAAVGGAAGRLALPADAGGNARRALLTIFYCTAMSLLFFALPLVPPAATAALNFEPIALLVLAWAFLGQTLKPLQVAGALLVVGAIAWLGAKR
jgi:drug/metabolite transporter (DMT)-like permease